MIALTGCKADLDEDIISDTFIKEFCQLNQIDDSILLKTSAQTG